MVAARKIVLHTTRGYTSELDSLVAAWMREGVKYVGVVGTDAARIEDIIDELCVGDGSEPYFMLTASHTPDETLQEAIALAELITECGPGPVAVVEF